MSLIRPSEDEEIEIGGLFYGYLAGILFLFVLGSYLQKKKLNVEKDKEAYKRDFSSDKDMGQVGASQGGPAADGGGDDHGGI